MTWRFNWPMFLVSLGVNSAIDAGEHHPLCWGVNLAIALGVALWIGLMDGGPK